MKSAGKSEQTRQRPDQASAMLNSKRLFEQHSEVRVGTVDSGRADCYASLETKRRVNARRVKVRRACEDRQVLCDMRQGDR